MKSGEDENSPKVIPTIYLEDLYENYKVLFEEAANDSSMSNEDANAYAMKTTIAKIAEMCLKSKQKVLSGGLEDMDFCRFFRENHDKIIVRLVNRNYSQAYLAECPHRDFLNDFALVYGYFDKFCSDFGFIRITNSLMERIGFDEEKLYQLAMENTPLVTPFVIKPMSSVLGELMLDEEVEVEGFEDTAELLDKEGMAVATNKGMHLGANVMHFFKELAPLAQRYKSGLYILPSSIHECVIIPCEEEVGSMKFKENVICFKRMVTEINKTQVRETERLSDNVFFFDKDRQEVVQLTGVGALM